MNERKIKILQCIIYDYINSGEPVGSRTIAKKYNLGISPATIRNEMADLEEMGYLEQIHSSSGRIPSDKGYRLYVDKLMKVSSLNEEEKKIIRDTIIKSAAYEIDKIVKQSTMLLSKLTNLTCLVRTPSITKSTLKSIQIASVDNYNLLLIIITDNGIVKNSILRIKNDIDSLDVFKINSILNSKLQGINLCEIGGHLIEELNNELPGFENIFLGVITGLYNAFKDINQEEIYLQGATNILNYPEYNDINKAKEFLSMLDDKEKVYKLLNSDTEICVKIGAENFLEDAKNCSVISATYSIDSKPWATIGVIGPRRIPYAKIISIMDTIVKEIDNLLMDDIES